MKRLALAALLVLAALPATAQPEMTVDPATAGVLEATWLATQGAARNLASRAVPYVLSLHLALVLLDLALYLYRHQFTADWLGGFFWRVIAHLVIRTLIAWAVVPNPLTGPVGWGYAVIGWAHEVGGDLTTGVPGGGLSPAGMLITVAQFLAVLVWKAWVAVIGGAVVWVGVLAPMVYISFWLTLGALLVLVGWLAYVTIDAVLVASVGFLSLAFYGSEYTAPLGNRYLVALVQRSLKLLTAYFMVGLGLELIRSVWIPFVAAMNPINPLSWIGLMLMVVVYAWFAVWRLPRTVAGAFGDGDAIRLDTLLHPGSGS